MTRERHPERAERVEGSLVYQFIVLVELCFHS